MRHRWFGGGSIGLATVQGRPSRQPLSFTLFLVVFVVSAPSPAQSQSPMDRLPQLIRIIGALLSPGEETGERYPTLDVRIAGKPRTLYVREVQSLTSDDWGWPILRNLGAFLTLIGPPALIDRLDSEEIR